MSHALLLRMVNYTQPSVAASPFWAAMRAFLRAQ